MMYSAGKSFGFMLRHYPGAIMTFALFFCQCAVVNFGDKIFIGEDLNAVMRVLLLLLMSAL